MSMGERFPKLRNKRRKYKAKDQQIDHISFPLLAIWANHTLSFTSVCFNDGVK